MNAKQVGNSDISMLKRAWEFIKYICIYNRAQIKTNVNVANKSPRDTSVSAVPVHFFYLNLISINTIMAPKVAKRLANLICLSKDSFHSTSLHPSTSYNCLLDIEKFSFLHLVSMCMFHWMARINPFFFPSEYASLWKHRQRRSCRRHLMPYSFSPKTLHSWLHLIVFKNAPGA